MSPSITQWEHRSHMTRDTVNVLIISWAGKIAWKLVGKILNVLEMYRVGKCWVHCPFPCDVLAMYRLGTPPLAPSVLNCNGLTVLCGVETLGEKVLHHLCIQHNLDIDPKCDADSTKDMIVDHVFYLCCILSL